MQVLTGKFDLYASVATSYLSQAISYDGKTLVAKGVNMSIPLVADSDYDSIKIQFSTLVTAYDGKVYENGELTGFKSAIENIIGPIFDLLFITPDLESRFDFDYETFKKVFSRTLEGLPYEPYNSYVFTNDKGSWGCGLPNVGGISGTQSTVPSSNTQMISDPVFVTGYVGRCFIPVVNESLTKCFVMMFDSTNGVVGVNTYNLNRNRLGSGDALKALFSVEEYSNDPYKEGGVSGTGGGTGDFDGKSDSIEIPDLPTVSATDAGFITLFNPSLSQMRSLAAYMWSDLFDLDGWRKLFANPMDAILGLSIVPVAVPSGGTKEVKVGNIGTGVSMTTASTQYVAVDCGILNVNEYWGAYLDYEPFTKAEIYLPYIGTHAIAVDDIMGKAVHVVYHVDILSGACCAYVKCGSSVLYTFIGQCSSSIPITGDNWTNVVNGVLNIAGSIGSMVATGGASAPLALGEIASTSVNAMKPSVEKSGSMSGTGGMMAIQTPYLILTRPRQAVPKNQNKYTGYPSYITKKLSSLNGYTEVESIHIEGVYATESEMSELYSLLASGVIF